jgi:hypothetical protein
MSSRDGRLRLGLFAVMGLILYFGLQPFDFAQTNRAQWLDPGPGLRFDKTGLAISTNPIAWSTDAGPAPVTVQLWLRTSSVADTSPRAWLVFVDESRLTPLGIRQEGADLIIWDAVTNPDGERWYNDFRVPYAMRPGVAQHIAITSHDDGPRIYVGGTKAGTYAGYPIPLARQKEPFGGTLVIGAGPPWTTPWTGDILALALHNRALAADEIEQLAVAGPGPRFVGLTKQFGAIAAYSFDEGDGTAMRNVAGGAYDLWMPEYFRPPGSGRLQGVDTADRATLWNVRDMLLNVLGFAPLGFLIALLLRERLRPLPLLVVATLTGFGISFGIEWTQSLMVTRHSSIQDLVLNTVGALGGAVVPLLRSRISIVEPER